MTASKADSVERFTVSGTEVRPGNRVRIELPVARLVTGTMQSLPVTIVHGGEPGPALWLSAALHGDELNGVEIIRRVLGRISPDHLAGTVWAVPVVNVFGFIEEMRYLPDRRDLNRSFPGSPSGSLAARLAHLFMRDIVSRCTHGIDLHTGSDHRTNYPQIRADLDDPETLRCAAAFGTRFMIHARTRDGSLRQAAAKHGVPCLVYEAGEPNRFNHDAIVQGVAGVLGVMHELGMIDEPDRARASPTRIDRTAWVRARRGGILRLATEPGASVTKHQTLGVIADAFGDDPTEVRAPRDGYVLGLTLNPLVHQGDGVAHLAFQ